MNRRKALWLGALAGGLWPARLLARDDFGENPDDLPPRPRRRAAGAFRSARRDDELGPDVEAEPPAERSAPPGEPLPADMPNEPGHAWRSFDLTRYTSLPHTNDTQAQNALIEWIFRRTGSAAWHGDRIAVLCASRSQLRAYNNAKILKQVDEMVERFLRPTADFLSVRVHIVAASDPRWRYLNYGRLAPVANGPQGQQVWSLSISDAAAIRAQMALNQGFKPLYDRTTRMVNGQTLTVRAMADPPISYVVGPQREAAAGLGVQPGTGQLEEGIVLRLSPLLTYEGDALELALDLKSTLVRKLHSTRIMTRREIGPVDMAIDVPEVSEGRLNVTLGPAKPWRLGQTLLISGGIQPGILQNKSGLFNLRIPGTVPTETELLVFLDAEVVAEPARSARARD